MLALAALVLVGLGAGVLSGVVGTGSSIILLPLLVWSSGPKAAVPTMAIAALMANTGRVLVWWRSIRWRAVAAYGAPGIPAAALGAHTLLALPPAVIDAALAAFFLGMIPLRRLTARRQVHLRYWQLGVAGAVIGFLTGLVLSTGPLSVPAFTGFGLTGGSFLGTEAASSLLLYISKLTTFEELGALPAEVIVRGLAIGASLMLGALLGRVVVERMTTTWFHRAIDGVLVFAAGGLLVSALAH